MGPYGGHGAIGRMGPIEPWGMWGHWAHGAGAHGPIALVRPMGPSWGPWGPSGWMAGGRRADGRQRTASGQAEHRNINRNHNIKQWSMRHVGDRECEILWAGVNVCKRSRSNAICLNRLRNTPSYCNKLRTHVKSGAIVRHIARVYEYYGITWHMANYYVSCEL